MARRDKPRSVRRDPRLTEGRRDVILQPGRRFFTAQGSDQATRQARALSNALGVGLEAYTGVLERGNVKGAAQAAQEAAAGGERDETVENKGYNEAFDQVEAANDLASFASELPEMLEKEGWLDLDEPAAQARIDEYYAEQLRGINQDSVYGKTVAAGILQQNEKLLDVHREAAFAKGQQERRVMVYNEAKADYENNGVLDHEKLMERLHTLVPGPGGRKTYLDTVFELSEDAGDTTPIDTMPERFKSGDPTGITDPNMKDLFDTARAKAVSVREKRVKDAEDQFRADNQTARAGEHSILTTRAKAGDASVIHDIDAGGVDGPESPQFPDGTPRLLSRPQQKLLYDQLSAAQLNGAIDSNAGNLFGEARLFGATVTEYDNGAANFAGRLNEKYSAEHPEWDEKRREAEVLKVVIERSFRHDRLPKFLTDFLNVSPSSPERFAEAVNVKRMVDKYDETLVQRSISDRNAAMMDVYELVLKDSGDEKSAMEALGQYDHTLSNGRGDEIKKIADGALEDLAGDSGFWAGDYDITTRDRQRAEELTKHYMNLGYVDDRAESFVVAGMRGRNTRVQGILYPVDAGWRAGDLAADWYLAKVAPDFFAEATDMVMKPHPTKGGYVVIQNSDAKLPYASPEVQISEIENGYQRSQDEQLVRLAGDAEATVSAGVQEAEKRAFDAAFPPANLVYLEPGSRAAAMKRNREAWDNLPRANRERLIQAQMKQ